MIFTSRFSDDCEWSASLSPFNSGGIFSFFIICFTTTDSGGQIIGLTSAFILIFSVSVDSENETISYVFRVLWNEPNLVTSRSFFSHCFWFKFVLHILSNKGSLWSCIEQDASLSILFTGSTYLCDGGLHQDMICRMKGMCCSHVCYVLRYGICRWLTTVWISVFSHLIWWALCQIFFFFFENWSVVFLLTFRTSTLWVALNFHVFESKAVQTSLLALKDRSPSLYWCNFITFPWAVCFRAVGAWSRYFWFSIEKSLFLLSIG